MGDLTNVETLEQVADRERYFNALRARRRGAMTQADLLKLRAFIRKHEHTHIGRPAPVETEVIDLDAARVRLRCSA
jgi:hypothetical protein